MATAGSKLRAKLADKGKLKALDSAFMRLSKKEGVPWSGDLGRILALPRRVWQTEPIDGMTPGELADELTAALKRPEGRMRLWPLQAKVLQELHDYRGCMGIISVGGGKTLISKLARQVLEVDRALLVVPAKLRSKTVREFGVLSKHWVGKDPDIVSYEKISRAGGLELLEQGDYQLVIFDEVQKLKNKEAAVTRKFDAFLTDRPDTIVLPMSGTITSRSLYDYYHILCWTVPQVLMPLPVSPKQLELWAGAVDVIKQHQKRKRVDAGELVRFFNDDDHARFKKEPLTVVREAVRRRVHETPAIIASVDDDRPPQALNVFVKVIDGYNRTVHDLFRGLANDVLPNGDPITEKNLPARWAAARTLTSGFWYTWDPKPPEEWLVRRREWKGNAAIALGRHVRGLESEGVLASLITRGGAAALRAHGIGAELSGHLVASYEAWARVKDEFKPVTVPVWVDDRMVNAILEWAEDNRGIIWVSEVALGQRLEQEGLPFYHRMGLDAKKRFIDDAKPKDGCIVASVLSNAEGRNLQHWSNNLVISPPPVGTVWEQLLGRTHRPGQEEDEVNCDVFIGCRTEWECWQQACRDAEYQSKTENTKKLAYCTKDVDPIPGEGSSSLW